MLMTCCIGGANSTTNEINKLLGSLPPAVQALTGVDLTGVSRLSVGFIKHET